MTLGKSGKIKHSTMTNISKCIGTGCKLKYHCLRYTAPAGYAQAYSDFKPKNSKLCEHQIEQKCIHCGLRRVHREGCKTKKI